MTVKERINKMRFKTERLIWVGDHIIEDCFYLSDLFEKDEYVDLHPIIEDFVRDRFINATVINEKYYQSDGVKCIYLEVE